MLPDYAVHLLHSNGRATGTTQDTLQPPNIFERGAEDDVSIVLHHKIHRIAGLKAQALANSLRNHGLTFATYRRARHDGVTSSKSY
jgi:hypothetical protein